MADKTDTEEVEAEEIPLPGEESEGIQYMKKVVDHIEAVGERIKTAEELGLPTFAEGALTFEADEDDDSDEDAADTSRLPEFEGVTPVRVVTKLSGSSQRIFRPHRVGDRVILLVEATVAGVNHQQTSDGLNRVETFKAADIYELEADFGKDLLRLERQSFELAEDARQGRKKLPGFDTAPKTSEGVTLDENGVALTDDEVAAQRGLSPTDLDPVVIVYSDQSRALWPDDWKDNDLDVPVAPIAGMKYENPNRQDEEPRTIVQLLDAESGDEVK